MPRLFRTPKILLPQRRLPQRRLPQRRLVISQPQPQPQFVQPPLTTNTVSSSSSRYMSSSTTVPPLSLTPAEAGRRAQKRLQQEMELAVVPNNTVTTSSSSRVQSMDTILSHAGFVSYDNHSNNHNNNDASFQIPYPHNATLTPPIHLSTTFIRPVHGDYDPHHDAIYIRDSNPTRLLFEQQMSRLELTPFAFEVSSTSSTPSTPQKSYSFAMSSGMMAISTVIMAHSLPIHILLPTDLYHGVPTMLEQVLIPFCTHRSISYERVDMRDPTKDLTQVLERLSNEEQQQEADTKKNIIVWLETPSNPLCHVIDLAHTCQIIRSHRPPQTTTTTTTIVVDSTLAPPNITQPLLITPTTTPTTDTTNAPDTTNPVDGVDVVIHSGTKYIGGHSDTMGGMITVSPWTVQGQALFPQIQNLQIHQGGVLSSMDSYMMIRGLRTLHVRVERQSQSALVLAQYLQDIQYGNGPYASYIKRVYYPGLPPPPPSSSTPTNVAMSHSSDEPPPALLQQAQAQYEIATRQMRNGVYGSVMSLEFYTEPQAMAFIGGLQLLLRATSFGGTETVIEHRASIEPIELRTSPEGLVRISVGLENVNDLIYDMENAMRIMDVVCKGSNSTTSTGSSTPLKP